MSTMEAHNIRERLGQVVVPIFELDEDGTVKPNPLFHRPWDKLHSRCIEYPFAASQLGTAHRILDVGTAKSDPAWIRWLESLPIEVHTTDYDRPAKPFRNATFHQGDVRELAIPDNTFDKIFAVSVVEHVGLSDPQVMSATLPRLGDAGDVEAVEELVRMLRREGDLIMTLPFGLHDRLILGGSTRCYTRGSIRKFEEVLQPVLIHYYEYQHSGKAKLFHEYESRGIKMWTFVRGLLARLGAVRGNEMKVSVVPDRPGVVTWRRVSLEQAKATHYKHTDGIICGVWRKT
jgi:hypothetical protein